MTRTRKRKGRTRPRRLTSKARLDKLVEEATVDCYNESEQATGLYTMIEDNLALPFETIVLGVRVIVERVQLTRRDTAPTASKSSRKLRQSFRDMVTARSDCFRWARSPTSVRPRRS